MKAISQNIKNENNGLYLEEKTDTGYSGILTRNEMSGASLYDIPALVNEYFNEPGPHKREKLRPVGNENLIHYIFLTVFLI